MQEQKISERHQCTVTFTSPLPPQEQWHASTTTPASPVMHTLQLPPSWHTKRQQSMPCPSFLKSLPAMVPAAIVAATGDWRLLTLERNLKSMPSRAMANRMRGRGNMAPNKLETKKGHCSNTKYSWAFRTHIIPLAYVNVWNKCRTFISIFSFTS